MKYLRWLLPRPGRAAGPRPLSRRPARARPRLEALEERVVPTFSSPVNYPVPGGPVDIVAADFRGLGRPDLATSNFGFPDASVLLNNGDGTFHRSDIASGQYNQGIAAGDFDGEGLPDLAITNYGISTVQIYLSKGDGTFTVGQSFSCGTTPQAVGTADLEHDGKLDLITLNSGAGTISVFHGNGDGTFGGRRDFPCGGNSSFLTLGDFYGDGNLSVAVSNNFVGNQISILRGNGDGTFRAPVTVPLGASPGFLEAADLNGDGRVDLAVATSTDVRVLLNQGNGTFAPPAVYPAGSGPRGLTVADLNGDGFPDIAVSNQNSNNISVLLNRGDGTFAAAGTFAAGFDTHEVTAADFTGNGLLDLAATNYQGGSVTVLLNDGVWPQYGTFSFSSTTQPTAGDPVTLTVTALLHGVTDTAYTGTVHFTSSDPRAVLPADYTFTPADQGQHTFDVTFYTAGDRTVTAADAGATFTGTSGPLTVSPAAPSAYSVTGLPAGVTAGSLQTFTVQTTDAFGNFSPDYTGTVHFTSSDDQASLPGDYTFTAADHGSHVFAAVLGTAGTQSVTATDTSDAAFTGTQSGITVQPAAASTFLVSGFPDLVAGQTGTFTVTAEDPYGNVATGYAGTVRFTSSDPRAVLPTNYTFTAADRGAYLFGAELVTAGYQTLTATDAFNPQITGTQADIGVSPAALSGLRVSGFPSPTTAGSPGAFTVTAVDAYGNTVPTYAGAVHFTSSDPQATLPEDYLFTASDQGTHTFGAVLYTAGAQSLTATDDANDLSGSQSDITVRAAGPSVLQIVGLPASAAAGAPVTFTVTLLDAYGNVATGYTGTVHFTSSDPEAVLPADYTFTAQDAGSHTFAAVFSRRGRSDLTVADRASSGLQDTETIGIS
jgi:hypothetical protein